MAKQAERSQDQHIRVLELSTAPGPAPQPPRELGNARGRQLADSPVEHSAWQRVLLNKREGAVDSWKALSTVR